LGLGVVVAFSGGALLSSCASTNQVLTVETVPAGAEVYLQRRGVVSVEASVSGVGGAADGGRFEDDFVMLGNAPVNFEFPLSETAGGISVGTYGGGSVTKHYREGMVRVVMPGYQTVERLVTFTGSAVRLMLTLVEGGS
jgi:hypothetical protein